MSGPIFCDSRGEDLAQSIFENTGESECVFSFPGATIASLTDEICSFLKYSDPEYIYFSAGVNDLTRLAKVNYKKTCVSRFKTENELVTTIMQNIRHAICVILTAKPTTKVIMTPVVGISIADYNNRKKNGPRCRHEKTPSRSYLPDRYQHVINNGIIELNMQIIDLNSEANLETPLVHRYVHKDPGHGKPIRHAYSKLIDGLHPRPDTLRQWGNAYVTAITANINKAE